MSGDGKPLAAQRSRLLRSRKFLGYLGQSVASRASGNVANVCVVWLVFAATQSAVDVGIVAFAQSVAIVGASLPAGTIVDRYSRRWLLFLSHATRGAVFAILVALLFIQGFRLDLLVGLVLAWSAGSELYRSTTYSVLPDVIDPVDLADANGVTRASTSSVGAVASALAGGLIVAFGVSFGFVFSAAAYAGAAILAALFVVPRASTRTRESSAQSHRGLKGMTRELREGFRWLLQEVGLLQLSISATAFNFLFSLTYSFLVIYAAVAVHAGALLFGLLLAAYAVGDVVGSLLVGRTRALSVAGKVWVVLYGGASGLLLLILGFFPSPAIAIGSNLLMGLAIGFSANVWLTSAQNIVPAGMRGRYFAIDGVLSFVAGPPAIVAGAFLIQAIGVASEFILAGLLMLVSALVFGLMRSLWRLDGRTRVDSAST